jgi:flagellar motor switch protein FliG
MTAEMLTGTQKAAILMALIGEDAAGNVLRHLDPAEIRQITTEIARIRMIDPSAYAGVLREFVELVANARGLEPAGPRLARKLLQRAMPEEADRLVRDPDERKVRDDEDERDEVRLPDLPEPLMRASSRRIAMLLVDEAPQTAALVLAHLPPRKAARIMLLLPVERRLEVTRRMATIREIRPDVVQRVAQVLQDRLAAINEEPLVPVNGVQTAADTLTRMGRSAGNEIVEAMSEEFPDLSRQLRDMLFTFDMLRGLGDRDAQEVLRQVDRSTLALALKGGDPEVMQRFTNNMSERAAQMLTEEMDLIGAPRLAEIERAQRTIIELVLKLEAEGLVALEETAGVA